MKQFWELELVPAPAKFMSARHAKSPAVVSQHEKSVSAPVVAHVNQLPEIPLPKFSDTQRIGLRSGICLMIWLSRPIILILLNFLI